MNLFLFVVIRLFYTTSLAYFLKDNATLYFQLCHFLLLFGIFEKFHFFINLSIRDIISKFNPILFDFKNQTVRIT